MAWDVNKFANLKIEGSITYADNNKESILDCGDKWKNFSITIKKYTWA